MTPNEIDELIWIRRLAARPGALRSIRESSGLSLRDVASATGVGLATLSRWETGHYRPSVNGGLAYARLLRRLVSA